MLRSFAAASVALLLFVACGGAAGDRSPRIALSVPDNNPAAAVVEVHDLPASALSTLRARTMSADDWTALLRVSVASETADPDRPAVAGSHSVTRDAIRFTPRFPFDAGRRYEVRFDPSRLQTAGSASDRAIVEVVALPKVEVAPSTVVNAIYPTADVPENHLRFYVTFSAPMGRKGGLEYIHLLDEAGREVKDPFLPLDAEFWNADWTRYTVFVDPGRQKQGILPNQQLGRSLLRGRTYTIAIDREWRDAEGLPLEEGYRRQFRVGPPDERPLDTKSWRIAAPPPNTRDPLLVTFPDPLDHGLLLRAIGVAKQDESLFGDVTIDQKETRWSFTPRDPWTPGAYRLVVQAILEDLAGNRIGRAFEIDRFDRVDSKPEPDTISLPFTITAQTTP